MAYKAELKKIVAIGLIMAFVIITSIFFISGGSEKCQEKAFQQSALYGQPRRFFEITQIPEYSSLLKLEYLVSFYCQPRAILSVSKVSCELQETRIPLEHEGPSLMKLVKSCSNLGK